MKKLTQVAVKRAQEEARTLLFTRNGVYLYVDGLGVFEIIAGDPNHDIGDKLGNRALAVALFNELVAEGEKR